MPYTAAHIVCIVRVVSQGFNASAWSCGWGGFSSSVRTPAVVHVPRCGDGTPTPGMLTLVCPVCTAPGPTETRETGSTAPTHRRVTRTLAGATGRMCRGARSTRPACRWPRSSPPGHGTRHARTRGARLGRGWRTTTGKMITTMTTVIVIIAIEATGVVIGVVPGVDFESPRRRHRVVGDVGANPLLL